MQTEHTTVIHCTWWCWSV